MDAQKKLRSAFRRSFTKLGNEIEQLLKGEVDILSISAKVKLLEDIYSKMMKSDEKILEVMCNDENQTDEIFDEEQEGINNYKERYFYIQNKFNDQQLVSSANQGLVVGGLSDGAAGSASEVLGPKNRKNYRLPEIELKKFNGELNEWLGFWSQFSKIHEDNSLHDVDKFHYLVQSTIQGTRARDVIESFPLTAENYKKAIEALKERFGNKELLIEVYVRELLKMVINNVNKKDKTSISKMYDKLETQMRALESLDIRSKENSAWLYPLVESSLPDEILTAWQRSYLADPDNKNHCHTGTLLENLMMFLKNEVKGEERRKLAKTGFSDVNKQNNIPENKNNNKKVFPTAAGLLNNEKSKCIFCKNQHESKDCVKAQEMEYDERKNKVFQSKACLKCLKFKHFSKDCTSVVKCMMCGEKHLTIMCSRLCGKNKKAKPEIDKAEITEENYIKVNTASNIMCTNDVFLQTLVLKISGDKFSKTVRALIDTGSQRSYILESTAKQLQLVPFAQHKMSKCLFGGEVTNPEVHFSYEVIVTNLNDKHSMKINCLSEKTICRGIPRVNDPIIFDQLKRQGIFVHDVGNNIPKIEFLIGSDIYGKLLSGEVKQVSPTLTAIRTVFGWTLSGLNSISEKISDSLAMLVTANLVNGMCIPELWKLEAIGITEPVENENKLIREEEVKNHFLQTVTQNNEGRYCVSLPWIENKTELPSNYSIAEKRLKNTTKKIIEGNLYESYQNIFYEWVEENIIEVDSNSKVDNGHYLPHRPVIKLNSVTTKIRPVFDASCKIHIFPSLNNCLHKGPNLIEFIPSLILKFRKNCIGVISDIRKAFQQIEVNEGDREFLKFLWYQDETMKDIVVYQHRRVVFGVTCSPFLLAAVIEKHLTNVDSKYEKVASQLLKSFYIDNCVTSVNSYEEYLNFKNISTNLMAQAKMDLRMWEYGPDNSLFDNVESPVLGLIWNKKEDTLRVKFEKCDLQLVNKRSLLSVAHQIFDPIGFLSPILLTPKLILQQTWNQKFSWDEELPDEFKVKFNKWLSSLDCLKDIVIPRKISIGCSTNFSIHVFCDASQYAYACVIYLRNELAENVQVQLLAAKSRISPMKKITIPRLELLACVIGVRLVKETVDALNLEDVKKYFWSDSSAALAWIQRNEQWGTFVGNRVKEINKYSSRQDWRHVPGNLNPADLPSRGCSSTQLLESRWWEGPPWLRMSENLWPNGQPNYDAHLVDSERRKVVCQLNNFIDEEPFYYKFSKYRKIVRIICWMKRFIDSSRKKSERIMNFESIEKSQSIISAEEFQTAEHILIKIVQCETFTTMQKKLKNLKTFEDENGVIRVKTKLIFGEDPYSFKCPMVLPPDHHVVHLLIRHYHESNCHGGLSFLLSKLREDFWVINARKTVKDVLKNCIICKRLDGKSIYVPPPPLPKDRIADVKVFEIVGIDLAGPLYTRKGKKCWIVLFTCAVYRAVHLELVSALSTDVFLLSLRRFIARRGTPAIIYSDNGTNFVGMDNCFKRIDWDKVQENSAIQRIRWKFNPPAAPWWGGWWERIIRTVKKLLVRVLGKSSLDYEEINTVLCDIESTINDRPLTYISENDDELMAITPSLFLKDLVNSCMDDVDRVESCDLGKRLKYREKLKSELKQRFRKEYLGQLVQKYKEKNDQTVLSIGDVVLVGSENIKRTNWPIGKIVALYEGKDGYTRVADVKTNKGGLTRATAKIYPLETSTEAIIEAVREKIQNPNTSKETLHESECEEIQNQNECKEIQTRSGRTVAQPKWRADFVLS